MTTTQTTPRKPLKGIKVGQVVSGKRDKSRTVAVTFQIRTPKYGKFVRKQTKFQVHDPNNESSLGDTVEIAPCRPISKTKSYRLVRVVEKAPEQAH